MIVQDVDVFPVTLRFKQGFQISRGKIGDAGSLAPHVLVRLGTSDGLVGWGESRSSHLWSYETNETVVTTLRNYLAPCVRGLDAEDLEGLHRRMDAVIAPGITRGQPIAKSSLDIACHDLISRSRGISLSELLGGGAHPSVRLTFLVSADSGAEAEEKTRDALNAGYSGLKVKIGKGVDKDLEILSGCRRAAEKDFLWADANQAYGFDEALQLAKGAGRLDLDVLEQPIMATDRSGLIKLSQRSEVKIAIDESVFVREDLIDFVALGFAGAVVIKTAKSGGLLPARRMIEYASQQGLEVLGSGLTESMVGFSASLQLFHALGLKRPVDLNGPQFIEDHISAGPRLMNGEAVASGPGLGVQVDLERIKEMGGRQTTGRS